MDFIKLGSTREVNLDHVEYILEDEDKTGFTLHFVSGNTLYVKSDYNAFIKDLSSPFQPDSTDEY